MRIPFLAIATVALSSCFTPPVDPSQSGGSGVDEAALDRSADPCDDFFGYACGGWLKSHEIPGDRSSYGRFAEIEDRNLAVLHQLLDDAAAQRGESYPFRDKVGAFYAACMDQAKIDANSAAELAVSLKRIDAITDLDSAARELAYLHLSFDNALFEFGAEQDYGDATQMIGSLDQGGLGMPDRDYYLNDGAKSAALRDGYRDHVAAMLRLVGEPAPQAAQDGATVLRLEHDLAAASMSRVDRRDPRKIYHRIDLAGAREKAPHFPWATYLTAIGHPKIDKINVKVPEFFVALDGALQKMPVEDLKVYLRWHLVHGAASALGAPFVDENFHFFGATLNGVKELEPRWKRCAHATDRALGEALAIPYVRLTFGDDGKRATQEMVVTIEQAMKRNLGKLDWMDPPTRAAAGDKLEKITNMIGFPDRWRSYERLSVTRDSYLADLLAARVFEGHRELDKIGLPVDRQEWVMTPPTVNAYYEPTLNEMVFPAGILQPPFFRRGRAAALNYGAIGMVMGHELTHGFDDEGRKFDAVGNLRDWWSPSVNQEFERRAACVATQFDGYQVVDGKHINGKLTLGENLADLGGIKLAHAAFVDAHPQAAAQPAPANGFSDEQLFFLGVGQAWCTKRRPENELVRLVTDPHSTPRYRVNGPLSNLPEFAAAYACQPGKKMVRAAEACTVW